VKKIWALLSAFVLGLSLISVPANAKPETVETGSNGFAMGGYPNYWTICVANGYGPTAGVINNWNWEGFRLTVNVQNRCDGYSITNRMTIDNFATMGGACIVYTNTHKTWSPARGKYIWDQNPVVWINTVAGCFDNNTELYHNIQKGVGYVLGLGYNPNTCGCIMGSSDYDTNNIPYVTYGDALDMNVIYGG
jgi:hypothetical protein